MNSVELGPMYLNTTTFLKTIIFHCLHCGRYLDAATAEEILVDLVKLMKNAECPDHDLSDLSGSTLSLLSMGF